ncbi:Iron-sulfur cluster carrier protein [subsurface metagenome]
MTKSKTSFSRKDLSLSYMELQARFKDLGKELIQWKNNLMKAPNRSDATKEIKDATPDLAARALECINWISTDKPWKEYPSIFKTLARLMDYLSKQRDKPLDITSFIRKLENSFDDMRPAHQHDVINLLTEFLYLPSQRFTYTEGNLKDYLYEEFIGWMNDRKRFPKVRNTALQALIVYFTAFPENKQRDFISRIPNIAKSDFIAQENVVLLEEQMNFWEMNERLFKGKERLEKIISSPLPLIITILSRKGGVGKTTMAIVLALAIAKEKKTTYVMDMDFTGLAFPFIFPLPGLGASISIEQFFSSIELKNQAASNLIDHLFCPLPLSLGVSDWSNYLKIAQPLALPHQRFAILTKVASQKGYEQILRRFDELIVALGKNGVEVLILDNSPGFHYWPLLTFVLCLQKRGIPIIITSADVQDIGGLQIEWDLMNQLVQKCPPSPGAFWFINKVPVSIAYKYATAESLMYELRTHPALEYVPLLLKDRTLVHYLNLKRPQLISFQPKPLLEHLYSLDEYGMSIDLRGLTKSRFNKEVLLGGMKPFREGNRSLLKTILTILGEREAP